MMKTMEIPTLHLFCGIGGGSLGFQQAGHEYRGIAGRFRNLAGIDCDPNCCRDYERITGSKAVQMDLFDRVQYIAFWGKVPAPDWQEAMPQDIVNACGGEYPEVVFLSPPCKGFSGLLPEKSAKSEKYQALNRLVVRSMFLTMEAFRDSPPAVVLIENVPRITTRGEHLLREVQSLLGQYGYVFHHSTHDCGELAGLGQTRKRFLLIARHQGKVPSFIYQPPKHPLRTIGDILGPLPLPGDTQRCGEMHRIPNLSWKTWERLALIPAGKDWRALNDLAHTPRGGAWKIVPFDEPSPTVTGSMGPGRSNGVSGIADPRLDYTAFSHAFRVDRWEEPSGAVTSGHGYCGKMVADPRVGDHPTWRRTSVTKVTPWDEPAGVVMGSSNLHGAGSGIVADPRLTERAARYGGTFRVTTWGDAAPTVTGQPDVQNTAISVADPRLSCSPRGGTMGVMAWDEPGKTVTGSGDVHAGTTAVADPRIPSPEDRGVYVIIAEDGTWHRPITTFEMAMLQGLPGTFPDGSPLVLCGKSDKSWRERIGNMVPPPTATAIAQAILETLMPNLMGDWHWGTSDQEIWVQPDEAEERVVS